MTTSENGSVVTLTGGGNGAAAGPMKDANRASPRMEWKRKLLDAVTEARNVVIHPNLDALLQAVDAIWREHTTPPTELPQDQQRRAAHASIAALEDATEQFANAMCEVVLQRIPMESMALHAQVLSECRSQARDFQRDLIRTHLPQLHGIVSPSSMSQADDVVVPPLMPIADQLSTRLHLKGNTKQVIDAAYALLKMDFTDTNLTQRGRRCYLWLLNNRGAEMTPVKTATTLTEPRSINAETTLETSQKASDVVKDTSASDDNDGPFVRLQDGVRVHRVLEFDTDDDVWAEFLGQWRLDTRNPMINGRPHYVREVVGRETREHLAHLFHTIDPHYHVPRWVIGPAPGNENGWAFSESDAATPQATSEAWIAYDGSEWCSCSEESFRFVPQGERPTPDEQG